MIVVDTNTIAYLYIASEFTPLAERLAAKDSHWAAPTLWRSEMRNVLALYLRKKLLTFDHVLAIQAQAEAHLAGNEYTLESRDVLKIASDSGFSAYDCEFIALAQILGVPLVTTDKKLLRAFPAVAVSLESVSK
jgi:predicted nucleic acid-binding protein